jgi:uncharacterized membrane protein YesL
MAGFFGLFDYTKEGKGVYPDEPPKGPILNFFAIFGRKFWKIVTINLMYILFSLPALALAFIGSVYFIGILVPGLTPDYIIKVAQQIGITLKEGVSLQDFAISQLQIVYFSGAMTLVGLSLFVAGPVHAGVTYLLRNYAREEHAFVWSDFKDSARSNFKQSLLTGIISLVVTFLLAINYVFYRDGGVVANDLFKTFLQTFISILALGWCIMQMYIYPMMVTFKLSIKQLYKNALLFTIIRLPLNVLILILSLIIVFLLPMVLFLLGYGISVILALVWYLFLAFGLNLFLTNYFAYRGLDKYMVNKIKAETPEQDDDENADELGDFPADESDDEQPQDEDQDGQDPNRQDQGVQNQDGQNQEK